MGKNIWDLLCRKKRLRIGGGRLLWCQALEGVWGCLRVIEEMKAPSVAEAFGELKFRIANRKLGVK